MRALRLVALSLLIMVAATVSAAAQRMTLSGRVVDSQSEPIPYATVVLTADNSQVAGSATNQEGVFTLQAEAGEYTLHVTFIGYLPYTREVSIIESTNLGDITLEDDAEQIQEVVVTAQLIRREADRFVVDVANSPIALGKDGEELLKSAPGVWIQDDKVSINGSSGSKIYLNDREVRLEDEQLMAYIRSLRAEDIQRIEVIPQSGADYDASSSGGIIKITTKRNLNMGLMGSASLVVNGTKGMYNVMPSVTLNYNSGKLNLYGRAWVGTNGQSYETTEHTDYTKGSIIDAASRLDNVSLWGGANVGFVYDFNERHSVGAEVQFNHYGSDGETSTWTNHQAEGITTRTDGAYLNSSVYQMTTAMFNYIYRIDERGSTFKILGDYSNSNSPSSNDYLDRTQIFGTDYLSEYIYRNTAHSSNHLATATIALDKVLSDKLTLKAGLKYTYNNNHNESDYNYLNGEVWDPILDKNYNIGYSENIGAAYFIASARLGRWSLVGGLRGEYTNFSDNSGDIHQSYFKLFPNANISYSLTEKGDYSIVAQYARTISRPSFWALSPEETKISEYMIQRGNPDLKPSIDNSLSVTAVLKYKYTITLGVGFKQDAINQTTISDKDNPELLILQNINYPTMNNYYLSANLPFQFKKWWSANFNLMGMYLGQRINPDDAIRRNFMGFANVQMSFTLPKNFFIELSGRYMHGVVAGNTKLADSGNMNISLKKRMLNNKLTLKLGVDNIIPMEQKITIEEPTFKRTMNVKQPWQQPAVNFSISYNFNAGKQFRAKAVESGSEEDRGRIGSGQ